MLALWHDSLLRNFDAGTEARCLALGRGRLPTSLREFPFPLPIGFSTRAKFPHRNRPALSISSYGHGWREQSGAICTLRKRLAVEPQRCRCRGQREGGIRRMNG